MPAAIRSKGTLTVATEATYPPDEFIARDGHTVIGFDPDFANALGQTMGLKVKVANASFDSILPGLADGKYDLGISGFTDTAEREKTVDFVTYFSAGTSFYVRTDGGPAIETLDDLCGHKVSIEKGTVQVDDATAQSGRCQAAGRPGVKILVFPDQNATNLALVSGRADVGMTDSPAAAWQSRLSGGRFHVVGRPYGTAPQGIAVPKGRGMARPVRDAMKRLMAGGTYAAILRKWGVENGAVSSPVINAAGG